MREEQTMKTCFKCQESKPMTEFYKHSEMADGHLNKCKECTKKDAFNRRHFSEARVKILAYDRLRGNRQGYEYTQEYRKNNRDKSLAHSKVRNAIRSGLLLKGQCEVCGAKDNIHAHHDDYSKPLDVRWLCPEHHRQLHASKDLKKAS